MNQRAAFLIMARFELKLSGDLTATYMASFATPVRIARVKGREWRYSCIVRPFVVNGFDGLSC